MKTNLTKTEAKTLKSIQDEMMARRRELIDLQKKTGGCAAIRLKSENVDFCYNPDRKETKYNPIGEKFFLSGFMCGCPVLVNEFDVYKMKAA